MDTDATARRRPEVLGPGAGHHLHFLGHLATVKVAAGDDGALSVVEFSAPGGLGPPLHRHEDEDEIFVVLDGELVFHVGDDRIVAGAGGIAFLPHGQAHTFQVRSTTARFACVTASLSRPPRFDRMVAALGVATDTASFPEPTYIDATHVADVSRQHGIEVLGPPPPLA